MSEIDNKYEKLNNTCVYFHINPLKNEIFYVGIGNIKRPYSKHNRSLFWNKVKNKYGFIVDIVDENLSWKEACEKEKFYIKFIGRRDLKLGSLVNLTDGGDGTKNINITHRNHLRNIHIGKKQTKEHIEKRIKYLRGKKCSDETKYKISQSNKNKVFSKSSLLKMSISAKNMSIENRLKINEASKKPIIQYDLEGNFIKEWKSATDIKNELKIDGGSIAACCKNKRKSAGKYHWKYKIIK